MLFIYVLNWENRAIYNIQQLTVVNNNNKKNIFYLRVQLWTYDVYF